MNEILRNFKFNFSRNLNSLSELKKNLKLGYTKDVNCPYLLNPIETENLNLSLKVV